MLIEEVAKKPKFKADKDDILVQSLKICSKDNGSCDGCYYKDISDYCNKLEKNAADRIE